MLADLSPPKYRRVAIEGVVSNLRITTLAGIRKLKPAVDKFYALLSDEQKRATDSHIIFP